MVSIHLDFDDERLVYALDEVYVVQLQYVLVQFSVVLDLQDSLDLVYGSHLVKRELLDVV